MAGFDVATPTGIVVDPFDPVHDPATGLINRPGLELLVEYAIARSHRDGEPFSLLVLEVQCYDRETGEPAHRYLDETIAALGKLLRDELRGCDVPTRSNVGQLALLLAWTDANQSKVVIDHVAAILRDLNEAPDARCRLHVLARAAMYDVVNDEDDAKQFIAAVLDGLRAGRGLVAT